MSMTIFVTSKTLMDRFLMHCIPYQGGAKIAFVWLLLRLLWHATNWIAYRLIAKGVILGLQRFHMAMSSAQQLRTPLTNVPIPTRLPVILQMRSLLLALNLAQDEIFWQVQISRCKKFMLIFSMVPSWNFLPVIPWTHITENT